VGLYYLERYASTAANLRRVLMRRVERSARVHDTERDEGAEAIDDIIRRFQEWGYLDDKAFAEMRTVSLFRRGTSRRGIRYQLSMKGVSEDTIDAALESVFEKEIDPDRRAAIAYARRRRIGPWRKDNRDTFQERDLAALGRQGFAYGIARWIVEADSSEICEASLLDD
jgi:regulatory protein